MSNFTNESQEILTEKLNIIENLEMLGEGNLKELQKLSQ